MTRSWFALALLFVGCSTFLTAQDVSILGAKDLPGAQFLKTDSYAGKALFGYIDGGAELYLEYGFKKLLRQEIVLGGERYVVENYEMAGLNEAYGIFSVQRFRCVPLDSLLPNTCLSKYQLQAVVGDCYLSIVNESGSTAAQRGSTVILRALMGRMPTRKPSWPPLFSHEKLAPYRNGLIVAYGRLGLQNGYSEWSSLFESFETYTVMILPIDTGRENLTVAYINITCCGEIDEFIRLLGLERKPGDDLLSLAKDGTRYVARQLGKQVLVMVVASDSYPGFDAFADLLKR